MPLLRRQPFHKQKPPADLQPDEEVFYCPLTKEIFRKYENYFERIILCNSLVWTCSLTGKPGLTFEEARESERQARKEIRNFPDELKVPALYLATLSHRTCFSDLCDDVFVFARDRIFIGEKVEANVSAGTWVNGKVCRVLLPSQDQLVKYGEKRDSSERFWPPAHLFRYEVVLEDEDDSDIVEIRTVTATEIRRPRGLFTREKNRLFLKQNSLCNSSGVWVPKESALKKYKIHEVKFAHIFIGSPPSFRNISKSQKKNDRRKLSRSLSKSPSKTPQKSAPRASSVTPVKSSSQKKRVSKMNNMEKVPKEGKRQKKEKMNGDIGKKRTKSVESGTKNKKQSFLKMTEAEKEREIDRLMKKHEMEKEMKKEMKVKQHELERERKLQQKLLEKEKKEEEKRLHLQFLQNWEKPRDDLECEDLKNLPVPAPVRCSIPNFLFGDFIMVLEFLQCFPDILELKDVYPGGVTFDTLERALVEKEVAGPMSILVQVLLRTIFNLQENESEGDETPMDIPKSKVDERADVMEAAITAATAASAWSQRYQGVPIRQLPLDTFTVTEILRLHLLASGGRTQYNDKGCRDDPGLQFRLEQPQLLHALNNTNITELSPGDKLQVLAVLVNQILGFESVRDMTDENATKLRRTKYDLRMLNIREKHELASKKEKKSISNQSAKSGEGGETEQKEEGQLKQDETKEGQQKPEEEHIETEAERLKREKEDARKRAEFQKKEKDMIDAIEKYRARVATVPLGRDRAFRRFWTFNSIPGLFVEHDDEFVGPCLPAPTPYDPTADPTNKEYMAKYLKQLQVADQQQRNAGLDASVCKEVNLNGSNSSDKENEIGVSEKKPRVVASGVHRRTLSKSHMNECSVVLVNCEKVKVAEKANLTDSGIENIDPSDEKSSPDSVRCENKVNSISSLLRDRLEVSRLYGNKFRDDSPCMTPTPVFGMCTADPDMCPVHATYLPRTHWAFYSNPEELDSLIEALNRRGIREGKLREALLEKKEVLLASMQKCPVHKLDDTQPPREVLEEQQQRRSQRSLTSKERQDPNLNFPPGTTTEKVLELTLRDLILDMEEKVASGFLGQLKIKDRTAWRQAIEGGKYDKQCDRLSWKGCETSSLSCSGTSTPVSFHQRLKDEEDSRPVTPDSDFVEGDDGTVSQIVRDLASAILQLGQSIEPRYLQKPLGEDVKEKQKRLAEEEKKKKKGVVKKEGNGVSDAMPTESGVPTMTTLERWEISLMSCNSFPQLFLHISTLDNSIQWARSALNARCRVCRRKGDPEKMLLCDGCNKGYHTFCLRPPLEAIPDGEWFCLECRPKEKPKKRPRPRYGDESENEGSDDEGEEEAEEEEEESGEEEDGDEEEEESGEEGEEEEDEEGEDVEEEESSESEEEEEEAETCNVCSKSTGQLVKCDDCPSHYHLRCMKPSLKRVPSTWKCPKCTAQASKKTSKQAPTVSKKRMSEPPAKKIKVAPARQSDRTRRSTSKEEFPWCEEAERDESGYLAKRKSASDAKARITKVSKQMLRSNGSVDGRSDTPTSSESESRLARRSRRRGQEDDDAEENTLDVTALEKLLSELTHHEDGWMFSKPVSKSQAPDYHSIIKRPMDFGTMHYKLNSLQYATNAQFVADALLVFENCEMYNRVGTPEQKAGQCLREFFEKRCHELGVSLNTDSVDMSEPKRPHRSI